MCFAKKKSKKEENEPLKKDVEIDDHAIPIEELYKRLNSGPEGLTTSQAEKILKKEGRNRLTPPKKCPIWKKLLIDMFGGFNLLLWSAALSSLVCYFMEYHDNSSKNKPTPLDNLYLSGVLVTVTVLSTLFSFFQQLKCDNIMNSFKDLIPTRAHVLRDGCVVDIDVDELVRGDVVDFGSGDKIPADLRVISSRALKVDNSALTGESEPQSRNNCFTHQNPLESKNVVLFSTNVLEGSGRGIVILTGDRTVVGRIASLTANVINAPSPISKEIRRFVRIASIVAFIVAFHFFALSLIFGQSILKSLVFVLGIVVSIIPEGIVITFTACLTLTAVKMRKKFCLVKNLEAVETLGSTSVICSDKTGTLTQNRMTVRHLWFDGTIFSAQTMNSDGIVDGQEIELKGTYEQLIRCATLCSKSHFRSPDSTIPLTKRETVGDASEVAIMKYCELTLGNGEVDKHRSESEKICEIPFNSANKFQVSIHSYKGKYNCLLMKGAPEKILDVCSYVLDNGTTVQKSEEFVKNFTEAYNHLGGNGERVLGFCDLDLDDVTYPLGMLFDPETPNFPLKGLRFLGLISMIDPPRPGVARAVRRCQGAGIKVAMVTGDHPITAEAIAKQVHIIEEDEEIVRLISDDKDVSEEEFYGTGRLQPTDAIVIHGEVLKKISSHTLTQIVSNYQQVVFARTSPVQKLQIVEAYQKTGEMVAVTGDGVNDAPALRKADVGIAMGIAGTDVSKQAADMILLNDNFASIVTGVEDGRLIFDNLKKSMAYSLSSKVGECLPFISYIFVGIPLPLSVVTIMMTDFITDIWPAIALAYEVPEKDIMRRAPRNSDVEKLVNRRLLFFSYLQLGILQSMCGFAVYFTIMMCHGFTPFRLIGLRRHWDSPIINDLEDSFGQQWGFQERKALESCCNGGYFFAMVVVHGWCALTVCKTRIISLIEHGFENKALNYGIILSVLLSTLFLNTPYVNELLRVTGLRANISMIAVAFGMLLIMADETRRWAIRKWPNGFIYKETFY